MELELSQIHRKYTDLRVMSSFGLGKLVASLSEFGQQNPVLVVTSAQGGGHVLIDGYRRVAALERLSRDTVFALQLGVDEVEALVLRQQVGNEQRRSALEDGWLLRELQDGHGKSQRELALRLGKSVSWVSRRLGLVRELPDDVQQLVRRGWLPAQAAMKFLLPLSRDKNGACTRLAAALKGSRWTEREIGQIYETWRKSDSVVRLRVETEPRLFCRSVASTVPEMPDGDAALRELLGSIGRLGGMCRRLLALVDARLGSDDSIELRGVLITHWKPTLYAVAALQTRLQGLVTHD